jgi:prolyl 4-hydroxylase
MNMDPTAIAYELIRAAVSGVSKTQTLNHIKNTYNLTENELNQIVNLCNFKSKPQQIDYKKTANLVFPKEAHRYKYPFTQIYTIDGFLNLEDCQLLINESDKKLRPSTVSNVKDEVVFSKDRTSKTADLHYFNSPYLNQIDNKIASFMDLDAFTGEIMQTQKYEPGQYYRAHTDYFHPLTKEYKVYTEWMGQRTWTFMIYLNDVEEGGETHFKHLKLKLKPKAGTAVFWNNLYRNGIPNPKTLHEACPPVSGDKYVITKWFRSWSLI